MSAATFDALAERILARLEQEAPAHDVDIVSVEVVGASGAPTVRVRIDHADESAPSISLDEVTAETAWISELIDEMDPVSSSFTLEVSSPGLSRPLRRPHDFERFAGEQVSLKTRAREGRRHYTGRMVGFEDGRVLLSCDEGDVSFPLEEVASCNVKPDLDPKPKPGKGPGKRKAAGAGRPAAGEKDAGPEPGASKKDKAAGGTSGQASE